MRPKTELQKAIPLVLIAAFFNTLMIFCAKILAQTLPIQVILFARFLITFIIILPFVYFNMEGKPVRKFLKTKQISLHFIRDILGLLGIAFYFYAAKFITLADATVLFNTSPLFIPLIAYFWGSIKIIQRLWLGMAIGFVGVLFILRPGHELLNVAAFVGLFSGVAAAIAYVANRYLSYSEPPLRNMFYYFLSGTVISFVMLFYTHENFLLRLDYQALLFLLALGIFGYFYQLCFTFGAKYAPVRLVTPFLYASVIFSFILDWWFWRVSPSIYSLIGVFLIIVGAIFLLLFYPKDDFQKRPSKK